MKFVFSDPVGGIGFSAKNEANDASDVDLIVEFDPQARIGLFAARTYTINANRF